MTELRARVVNRRSGGWGERCHSRDRFFAVLCRDAATWVQFTLAATNIRCLPLLCVAGLPSFVIAATDEIASSPVATQRIAPVGEGRTIVDLDCDWRFQKGDFATVPDPTFDDSEWRRLDLPHDWSIEGPFSSEYASGTGFAPGGVGWYRKHFRLDATARGKLVCIEFDGVYNRSQVWINGHLVGGRPYGYSSFECDLTPHLKFGDEANVVAVRVDHSRFADSRWYTGSGIYRHVRLRLTERLRVAQWGTRITTPTVGADSSVVRIETTVANDTGKAADFVVVAEIVAPDGKRVGEIRADRRVEDAAPATILQDIALDQPLLWSPETPHLYTLQTRVLADSTVVDTSETPFGIRTISFDPDRGFSLNGVSIKLKGVCLHHDAGCLGAAVPVQVWERRLRTLKDMGVNAIRTSHNPPAPEFLDLCDRLGLLVKDEAFDEFTPSKNKWVTGWNEGVPGRDGYAEHFAEWALRDIQDLVRRDRNHPSVILWSIGNEIDYANDPFSHPVLGNRYRPENPPAADLVKLARPLIDAVRKLDPTRPVTAALATASMSDAVGLGEMLDVVGYNYQEARYAEDHEKYPRRVIFGSETGHQYSNWVVVRDNDHVLGQFLWTGIDYLGEARRWPTRGNGSGLLDLCGFKKPLAWFRQSLWSDQPMVYIFAAGGEGGRRGRLRGEESWNWPSNSTVTVRGFTTCPEVQLKLNGSLIGSKSRSEAVDGVLRWEVPFEPGVLTATGLDDGRSLCEFSLRTAGAPARVELIADKTRLTTAERDVCHSEFQVLDAQGVRVVSATNEITFELEGPAQLLGIGTADLADSDDCKDKVHRAFRGRGLAIIQTTPTPGRITITASSPGLDAASVALESE